MPAKAGIQNYIKPWIPAFAGMTSNDALRQFTKPSNFKVCNSTYENHAPWIYIKAGFSEPGFLLNVLLYFSK